MIQISIDKDLSTLGNVIKELTSNQLNRAVYRAVNRTIITCRQAASQKYTDVYDVAAGEVKKRLIIYQATNPQADTDSINAQLVIKEKGSGLPLYLFKARQKKEGVQVRIAGTTSVVSHAFIATMKSGHTGVYRRDQSKPQRREWVNDAENKHGGYWKVLPIRELFGVSPYQFFKARDNFRELAAVTEAAFEKNLDHEIEYAVAQAEEKSKRN